MTIRYFTEQEKENLKNIFPPPNWSGDIPEEMEAYEKYKSTRGSHMQSALRTRDMQQAKLKNQPFPDKIKGKPRSENRDVKFIPYMDNLIEKNRLPEELSGQPIYRGSRIDYGTALIKSGKKPGDTIRDPRYQSFSMDPGTAMYHTSKSQFGDNFGDDIGDFKRKKKVLLEHVAKGGEIGIYGGPEDAEFEVIYPRDKKWKITNVRDEDVTFGIKRASDDSPKVEGKQNVRIYTVERKNKKLVGKKIVKRKIVKRVKTPVKSKVASKPVKPKVDNKPIKKTNSKIIRKPIKKCKCK